MNLGFYGKLVINWALDCFYFTQAVKRMKTSPLTAEELACIQEVISFKSLSELTYLDLKTISMFFMHTYMYVLTLKYLFFFLYTNFLYAYHL